MPTINGQIFSRFDPLDDIVADRQNISAGLWSGGAGTLLTSFTSSEQTSSTGQYYLDVYNVNTASTTQTPDVQFAVAYGHKAGSGSYILNEQYPTRAVYSQYRNLLLAPTDDYFTIDGVNKEHIIVINFNRARIKDTLDPGNWQVSFYGSDTETYTVIDNSNIVSFDTIGEAGRVYDIVSGTIAGGSASNGEVMGLAYPDVGILVFDPDKMNVSASTACNTTTSDVNASNHVIFFNAISGAMANSNGFIGRNEEEVASTHYFVRAKNQQFNFSNNPTFTTGSLGDMYWQTMIKNPTVFITTVGLYNDGNELLGVGKLSQPLKKTFTREALIRVKLDY